MPSIPLAHETWFGPDAFPTDWAFAAERLTLALLVAAVLLTLVVRLIATRYPGVDVAWLGRCAPFMPFAVRIHLAVSLIGLLSLGYYLSPAMDLQANVVGIVLGAVMAVCAIGMATGFHARWAAGLLLAAGPLGMSEFGFWAVAQRIDLVGLALFVAFAGAGRWSADHELGRTADPSPAAAAHAVWSLKVAAGLALILVAFAEKLAVPGMAVHFLAQNPEFNLAQQAGLGWSDLEFARVAGVIEVLFGLLVISGALSQACVLLAGIPFNATLWFFGTTELVGHLPIYGAMLVLLVYASDPQLRPAVSALWPFGSIRSALEPTPAPGVARRRAMPAQFPATRLRPRPDAGAELPCDGAGMSQADSPARVLVAYASKHGSTAEIAEAIAAELRSQGLDADARRAGAVDDLAGYDAVVLGSAVYMKRWRREARHLLRKQARALAGKPFWIFSSGPFGEKPDPAWSEPPKVIEEAERLGAREHVVFGGRLPLEPSSFIERAMVRDTPPEVADLRDWDEVRRWAAGVAGALSARVGGDEALVGHDR